METYLFKNVSFSYKHTDTLALYNINMVIKKGDFVVLCGRSGSGKSTLLKQLKPSLTPNGDREGEIYFLGKEISQLNEDIAAQKIGFVMQNPDNQIVTDKVWHELAFGLENLGVDNKTIRLRVAEMASFFGITPWFHKRVSELSGGQKQLLNLASIMVMQPEILILDEPTSQLDPIAASEFLRMIYKINRDMGITVVITEHRLDEVIPMADSLIVMENGSIIAMDTPKTVAAFLKQQENSMFLSMPAVMQIFASIKTDKECPLTLREGREFLENIPVKSIESELTKTNENTIVELKEVWFRYEKDGLDVVKDLNLKINLGEFYAILGGNGTGKTTTLSLISGLNSPYRGEIKIAGKNIKDIHNPFRGVIGVLPQNPQALFVKKTVAEDLKEMTHNNEKVNQVIKECDLKHLVNKHPYDLSGGEQQRLALAKVLLLEPKILLLDEPTKGMDSEFKINFYEILSSLLSRGVTIIMVSHDIEFCANYAHRCGMFFDGNIVSEEETNEFFKGNNFYTTTANKLIRDREPNAITTKDVIEAIEGKPLQNKSMIEKEKQIPKPATLNSEQKKKNVSPNIIFTLLFIFGLVPLTVFVGNYFFDDRKYYFISLLIILEAIVPFFFLYEKKKPKARELVVISVLCAIAVLSRTAFFMVPQFKPLVAIIIISGICFGAESGFLIGVMSGFVSNFFFGQGPWTPFQMFALGIIGFISGILLYGNKNRYVISIYGAIVTFLVYGGILNFSNLLIYGTEISLASFVTAITVGAPFDLIHSLSSFIFLILLSTPMIEKLQRIKIKYGIIDI